MPSPGGCHWASRSDRGVLAVLQEVLLHAGLDPQQRSLRVRALGAQQIAAIVGTAIEARIEMMTTTVISSISVTPRIVLRMNTLRSIRVN